MFSRYGFPVLFVFLIICMQKTAASGAGLGQTCTANSDCDNTLVCDTTAADHKCRLPAGASCAAPNQGNCSTGLKCVTDICKITNGTDCTGHDNDCVDGAICIGSSSKQCICHSWRSTGAQGGDCGAAQQVGTAGGACAVSGQACTDGTTVCDGNLCRYKSGSSCGSHEDLCVDGALCQGAAGQKQCACGVGRTPAAQDGKCPAAITPGGTKVAVGGVCTATNDCDTGLVCDNSKCKIKNGTDCTAHDQECVDGATCTGTASPKVCICGTGRTPATPEGKCAAAIIPGAKVAVGGACTATNLCDTGLVCDTDKCKIKNGTDCTANEQQCVDGATCTGTASPKVCVCGTDRTPATTEGKCAAKNGAPSLLASLLFVVVLVVTSGLL